MMAYEPVVIDGFSGLRLDQDPEEVGRNAAVDMLDVAITDEGRLRQRDGLLQFITDSAASTYAIAYTGSNVIVAWGSTNVTVYNASTAASVATTTAAGGFPREFVRFGTPATSYVFYPQTSGNSGYWDGSAFATSAGIGSAVSLAQAPLDNRLAVAVANTSRVKFSDAGDPFTYGANNYVELDPGDDGTVTNLVTWNDQVFAFKRDKFFVFYGTSTDGTGQPVFNYRPVRNGIGVQSALLRSAAAAGPDGVYFVNTGGVYRTTGGAAVKVSQVLDSWFAGETNSLSTSLPALTAPNAGNWTLNADGRFVYFGVGTTRTFVFDTQTDQWTLYGFKITAAATSASSNTRLVGTVGNVSKISPTYTGDDGTPITWTYRSGLSDLGNPNVKLVKQLQLTGIGTVTGSVIADHGTTDPGAASYTLGTSPATAMDQKFYSRKGTFFSVGLSGTGAAIVNRATLGLAESRLPTMT